MTKNMIDKYPYDQCADKIEQILSWNGLLEPIWTINIPGDRRSPYGPIMHAVCEGKIVYTVAGVDGYFDDLFSAAISISAVRDFLEANHYQT